MSKVNTTKPKNALSPESDVDVFSLKMVVAGSALLCVLSTILFDKTKDLSGLRLPIFGFVIVALITVYLAAIKKLNTRNIVLMLFSSGFVLRLNYVLITSITYKVRQHDLYKFGGERGHSAYIEHFYNNGFTLPSFDPTTKAQFYHPPLHHFLSALWMRLLTTYGMSYDRAVASLPFLTCFYSMCSLVICERILDRLKLRGLGKIIPLAIITFHPTFIIFSGSVNNDNLATLFTLLAFYAAIKWYQEPTAKNILLIALAVGLGMSTKLSVALIAPAIAILFIEKFIYDSKNFVRNMNQYAAFAAVVFPLGLWFYIRNAVKFKVSMTYVPKLSVNSDQYIGNYTVYERLFDFSDHPFKNVFLNRIVNNEGEFFEYNPFVAIIKSSMFGEYTFTKYNEHIEPLCRILFILNIVMIIISIAASCYCIFRKSSFIKPVIKAFIVVYYILTMAFYFRFIFEYPHNCSMDFRYIALTFVIGAVFIGMALEQMIIDFPKKDKITKPIRNAAITLTSLFCIVSAIVYVAIGI